MIAGRQAVRRLKNEGFEVILMDIIGYIINGSCELYRSLRKPTVYTTSDVMTMRGAELIGKIFHGKRLLNFDLTYGRISDVVGLYSEIFLYKCYDFVCDNEAPFIIDGGANIGMATLRFKTLYPKAEIIAFEPQPDVCERLRANIKANGLNGVQVVEKAVCDTEGELILNRTIDGVTDCCASLDVTPNMNDQITVKTTSLLPYITRRVDCLKLDIEGSE
jgi:FkbM family methyltransferase